MVNIRNKFLETHCNVRLKQERLVTGKEQAGLSVEVSKALCEISMTSNCPKGAGRIPPALKRGHGRAYYTNGPLVAGASSLPAKN